MMKTKKINYDLKNVIKTYKFYDKDGRRLAIFAVPTDTGRLHVFMAVCSEKDQFSREVANIAFSLYMSSPTAAKIVSNVRVSKIAELDVTNGKSKKALMEFARHEFFVMKTITRVVEYPAIVDPMTDLPSKIYENKGRRVNKLSKLGVSTFYLDLNKA